MLPVQAVCKARPLIVGVLGNQIRTNYNTIVSTPPRNRVSVAEKLAHGVAMFVGVMATPIYIVTNFKNYTKESEEE